MAIKTLFTNVTDDFGMTEEMECPKCHRLTSMRLYSNYDLGNIPALILKKNTRLSFIVCPQCASVFKLADTYVPGTGQKLSPWHILYDGEKDEK